MSTANAGVVYIYKVPDRFALAGSDLSLAKSGSRGGTVEYGRAGDLYDNVRRPTRGIQLRDETFATLRILKGDGTPIPLVNAGSRIQPVVELNGSTYTASDVYSNFFIQQVEEQRMEKQQIVETFGEPFIFFYGERPRIISIAGVLLNTFDFNWEAEWWHNYETVIRGTKCVENDARVFLTYDNTLISGYIFSATASKLAAERNWIPFNFQIFVTDYTTFSELGDQSADQEKIPPIVGDAWKKYTPKLILDSAPNVNISVDGSGKLIWAGEDSLYSTIQNTSAGLADLFNTVANFSNNAMVNIDTWLGGPVRIPEGWAGAFEYPVESTFKIVDFNQAEPIRYTVFGDNEDEFVWGKQGAQYASSMKEWGDTVTSLGFGRAVDINTIMTAAQAEWAKYGLFPPPWIVSNITKTINSFPPGAMLLGKARGWARANVAPIAAEIGAWADITSDAMAFLSNSMAFGVYVAEGLESGYFVASLFGPLSASAQGVETVVTRSMTTIAGRSGVVVEGV
jgi:hypothetical protein